MSEEGRRLRDEGMARVESNEHPAWKAAFWSELLILARSGRVFTSDDIIETVGMPVRENAVGSLMSSAARKGLIVQVGFGQSERKERHAGARREWQGTALAKHVDPEHPGRYHYEPIKPPTPVVRPAGPSWRCYVCGTVYPDALITPGLSPNFGKVACIRCMKTTLAVRSVVDNGR